MDYVDAARSKTEYVEYNNYFLVMRRRDWLHGLVGRPGRFDVAAWIIRSAKNGYFTQRDAVLGVGDNQGEVRSGLEALVDLGLVEKARSGSRPHYRRVDSPVWMALGQLADAVDAMAAGQAAPPIDPDPPRGLPDRLEDGPVALPPRRSKVAS